MQQPRFLEREILLQLWIQPGDRAQHSSGAVGGFTENRPDAAPKKILIHREEIEGERKLVTVLFTDIISSTTLAEKLDPADWGEIVSGAHRRVTQAIFRYEGTIAQLSRK